MNPSAAYAHSVKRAGMTDIVDILEKQKERINMVREAYPDPDDFSAIMVLRETIIPRYLAMIQVDGISTSDWSEDKFGASTSISHLKNMLLELRDNLEQSVTKKHRWLGFVQGLLIAHGFTTVQRERDITRGVFNGS